MVVVQHRICTIYRILLCVYNNVKRLAVIESHVCVYVVHYFMYLRNRLREAASLTVIYYSVHYLGERQDVRGRPLAIVRLPRGLSP
jgi:hypothetical protein